MERLKRYNDLSNPVQYRYITKYERAKALGVRSNAISQGLPTLIDIKDETCPLRMAELELEANVLPIIIKLTLCDGTKEYWEFDENQYLYKDLVPTEIVEIAENELIASK